MDDEIIVNRKSDHISINLEKNVSSMLSNGFEAYRFLHSALPEIDLAKTDTSQQLFGKTVAFPLLISSMTGGTDRAAEINCRLATAAEKFGLAMGLGSQRAAIENPKLAPSFQVRKYAPSILLFANLGAVQFNYGYGIRECIQAVEMIDANGLILHLNPLQEAIQKSGDTNFEGLLPKIEKIARDLPVPLIVKEVGWGISAILAKKLMDAGVSAVDVSGAGGTSWSQVERYRLTEDYEIRVAESFLDWGLPTSKVLTEIVEKHLDLNVFASGGLRSGLDLAKAIALGADLAGMAGAILKRAAMSSEQLEEELAVISRIFRIAMFATGSINLVDFKNHKIEKIEK